MILIYVNYLAAQVLHSLHYSRVMTLRLEIISEHREMLGDDAVCEFQEEGGTIGRSLQNDWILPDSDRYISGRHATIDVKGGVYYLLDTSTNGVYLNGDCEPIGKGKPQRLFNGDNIRMGDFEITVGIDEGESLVVPLDDTSGGLPGHDQSIVEEDPLKTGMLLLDEEEITGDDEFQSALFGESGEVSAIRTRVEEVYEDEPSLVAAPAIPDPAQIDLIDSFLDGLGVSRAELHPSTDLAEVMQNAGEVMREYIEGTTKLLASRSNLKNAFRLDQTTVLPRHNNPLKLAANTNDSIKQLLVGQEGEYLGPRDAVREVCRDLLFHQDAFLDAMNSAFIEFADRFDPDELAEGFDDTLGKKPLLGFLNRNKYWNLYCDLYPILTAKGGGRFPQMYSEEFVKAYELQIAEFKRDYGGDIDLQKTVTLHKSELRPIVKSQFSDDEEVDDEIDEDYLTQDHAADQAEG